LALGRLTSENQCRCADHIYTASNTYSDFNANAYAYSDADTMRGEMLTHAEASRDRHGAAHSAATPHTTADSYRFATPDSGAAPVATRRLEAQETMSGRVTSDERLEIRRSESLFW
jgi:hypothetical protein